MTGSSSSNGIVSPSTTNAVYGGSDSDNESNSDSSDSGLSIGGSSTSSSSGESKSSSGSSSTSSSDTPSGTPSGSEGSSSESSNSNKSNDNSSRAVTELEQSEPPQGPSSPPPAYKPPPPTAQARARERLGYKGTNSALFKTSSVWGEGTARTGIRPPGYSLASVRNNNVADPVIDQPSPAIVPAVIRPPPYHLHLRDRFLETNLAASIYDPDSPNPPPPAYGVAPGTPFLITSSARIARSAAAARSVETIDSFVTSGSWDTTDTVIDLERGDRGWRGVSKSVWYLWAILLITLIVVVTVGIYYYVVPPNGH